MLSEAGKWEFISIGAPLLGNMDGCFLLRAFLLEEFLSGPLKIRKCPVDDYLSPLGNLEGVRLLGLLREKKYIWVPFLDLVFIKILSLGAKAPMPRYGAQRARPLRPRCIGAEWPRTQLLIQLPTYLSIYLRHARTVSHVLSVLPL